MINGTNFYRLQQVDRDGRSTYSGIQRVNITADSWNAFPNPAVTQTTIYTRSALINLSVTLFDVKGNIVYKKQVGTTVAGQTVTIPLSKLTKGIYLLKVSSDAGSRTEKLIIQ